MARCVNIDWLEVYALEDATQYPMNAEYFREHGYWVKERDYGTRVWQEVFEIQDDNGQPWLEVRREPASGNSTFVGVVRESVHLRLKNWACYLPNPVRTLIDFMLKHNYIFKRIYRIDICNDFTVFDSGDQPARFARRYIEGKFAKVNQCKLAVYGNDGWAHFDWESLSWGSPTSMVSTKMYNKTKELSSPSHDKPYIRQAWFEAGIIDNPLNPTEVWRVEFSMKSTVNGWLEIENIDGKKIKKKQIPHTLQLFEGKDRIWQRFEELAYHYFHFRHVEYKSDKKTLAGIALENVRPVYDRPLKRKDLCRDKILFKFNLDKTFYQIQSPAPASKPDRAEAILRKHLEIYRVSSSDMEIRKACDIILETLRRHDLRRVTPHGYTVEIEALELAIATRTDWPLHKVKEKAKEMFNLIKDKEIW